MQKNFGALEKAIENLFSVGTKFHYTNIFHTVCIVGKPKPNKGGGEPKTDLYVETIDQYKKNHEFKFSIKLDNWEFIENRLDRIRFKNCFSNPWLLRQAFKFIKNAEKKNPIVTFDSNKSSYIYKLGVMAFLTNKKRTLSFKPKLTNKEKLEIFCGYNLPQNFKNAKVCGSIIKDSGVANFFIKCSIEDARIGINHVLTKLETPNQFIKNLDVHFAFTRINYISHKNKWDGNRPLFMSTDFKISNKKIAPFYKGRPFLKTSGDVGNIILQELDSRKLNTESVFLNDISNNFNFNSLLIK